MKKEILSKSEKHESITIRRRLTRIVFACENCGHRFDEPQRVGPGEVYERAGIKQSAAEIESKGGEK